MSEGDAAGPGDELLAAAYALDGPDANRAHYARWAETYESGFIASSRYVYHDNVAKVFVDHALDRVASTDVIVDVGCGTGLVGAALRRHAASPIDGIDISPEMLQQAAAKHYRGVAVYRRLIEADLTRPLTIEARTYAGAISVGTFTHGHLGPAALAEVVRMVRPGGIAALGINGAHFSAFDFGRTLEQLQVAGRIDQLRIIDVPIYEDADMENSDQVGRVAVFSVGVTSHRLWA